MKCPRCEADLMLSERQGVEIDYCPKCRGVWLDRGELDKILARQDSFDEDDDEDRYRRDDRRYEREDEYRQRPRKKSFWRELLDFD